MILQLLTIKIWLQQIFKLRLLNLFAATNFNIPQGGMLLDRKTDVYNILPISKIPRTIFIKGKVSKDQLTRKLVEGGINFPVFVKPDIGFRGYLAEKFDKLDDLHNYLQRFRKKELLIQEYINLENEYSVLYYKYPLSNKTGILSFVRRDLPFIVGDGRSNVELLIKNHSNERISKKKILKKFAERLDYTPDVDEKIKIDFKGNYVKGATIVNLDDCINNKMIGFFSEFVENIGGLNFIRIDIKANGIKEIENGDFIILEINGAKSESLHLYDESMSKEDKLSVLKLHWKIFFEITAENIIKSKEKLPKLTSSISSIVKLYKVIYFEDSFSQGSNYLKRLFIK